MTRSESREQAFIIIFESQFNKESIEEIIALAGEIRDVKISSFAKTLIASANDNSEKINEIISQYAKKWSLNRISKVSLSVLQLAIGEILTESDVPIGVTINEAVELCKKYGGEDDFSFVNGILGAYSKTLN